MGKHGKKYSMAAAALCIMAALLGGCAGEDAGRTQEGADKGNVSRSVQTQAPAGEDGSAQKESADGGREQESAPQEIPEEAASMEVLSEEEKAERLREELAQEIDERILALSEQEWMLKEAARGLVADRLAATSFVTVEPREQFSVAAVVLDEVTGNLVVSEGAKAMYRSITEGKSVSDICRDTLDGAAAQIPQYLADEAAGALQDMVTDLIGVDVFSALDFISQWQNADDMPVVLLQSIVEEQRRDVYRLTLFLEQEEISAADLYRVAQLMYAIQMREQEIAAVRDTGVGGSWSDFRDMRVLAGEYAANEAELLLMAQAQIPEGTELSEEAVSERFAEEQRKVQEKLAYYSTLAGTELGDISANYDVEGFREAQKATSQQGMFGEALTGNLLGGLLAEGGQMNEDWVQENRAALCDRLTDFMEESYLEVAEARADLIGQYGMLQELASASGEERGIAGVCLGQAGWEEALEEAAGTYLGALSKYLFDVGSAYILYDCILTDAQADFLFSLVLEKDQAEEALRSCAGTEYSGYSDEEATDRWNVLLECYQQVLDQIIERGVTIGETPGLHVNGSLTVYGDRAYTAYSKEYTADSKPLAIIGGSGMEVRNPRYYYDTSGNLLCVVYGTARITYRNNVALTFLAAAGGETQYRWKLEIGGWELQRITDYTVEAQGMYNRFVN